MSEQVTREARDLVKAALDASDGVKETWLGPRSTEIGFVTVDGVTVLLSFSVKELLA